MFISGSYQNYLHMDKQMGFEEDTNARIQYRTAMIMKKQQRKKVSKQDLVSTQYLKFPLTNHLKFIH